MNCTDEELVEMIHYALIQACEDGSYWKLHEECLVRDAMINLPSAARELRKDIGVTSCTDEQLGDMLHDALIESVADGWWHDFGAREALILDGLFYLGIAVDRCARSALLTGTPTSHPSCVGCGKNRVFAPSTRARARCNATTCSMKSSTSLIPILSLHECVSTHENGYLVS